LTVACFAVVFLCVCIYTYIYISIYIHIYTYNTHRHRHRHTHRHTHTHTQTDRHTHTILKPHPCSACCTSFLPEPRPSILPISTLVKGKMERPSVLHTRRNCHSFCKAQMEEEEAQALYLSRFKWIISIEGSTCFLLLVLLLLLLKTTPRPCC
jgi:hypothetical protein